MKVGDIFIDSNTKEVVVVTEVLEDGHLVVLGSDGDSYVIPSQVLWCAVEVLCE